MNKFEWIDDPERIGHCWDYVNEKDARCGYVMDVGYGKWSACANFSRPTIKCGTFEEAKAVVEALIAMDN